ncbi:MAG TPA: oxidoreductase [Pseudoxanthomonas sp.]|nr:oxidoreductase [Pseudoxanthomonas sp.]
MNDASPIRIALIGYGYAGKTFHAPLIASVPGLQLARVVSSRPGDVHADLPDAEVVADPLQAIGRDDVDLVVIAAPNAQHAPLAAAALRAGKHVVVDKPFTLTLAEARELRAAAKQNGRLLSVFHNRRWDSDFLGVKQAIDSGRIGEVVHFESHIDRFRPQVRARWRESAQPGAGIWFDLGPHLIDQALQLFGLPQSVQAGLAALRPGALSDDWSHVVLSYEKRRVVLHASMLVAGGSVRFIAHGTLGSVVKPRIDRQEAQLLAGMKPGDAGWGEDDDMLLLYPGDAPMEALPCPRGDQRLYYAGIRDAIHGLAIPPVTDAQALAVMAVLEAGTESARTARVIELGLDDEERESFERNP